MSRFEPAAAFQPAAKSELLLLPMRFEPISADTYVAANLVGDMLLLSRHELERIIALDIIPGDGLYERAFAKLLVAQKGQRSQLQLLALRMRSRMAFLRTPTPLHIFVVTLRCEHSCPYCQVSRRSTDKDRFDMHVDTAMRGIAVAIASPSDAIKIEFQGGEPLLNFDLIKLMVVAATEQARIAGKLVEFVITTNLALLTDEILIFCRDYSVLISTSLDGPADIHNRNRPRPGGNSYDLAVDGIRRTQSFLGKDRVGALMTTTAASLERVEQIVDEYLALGLDGIFLRSLSPYGFAVKTKQISKYDSDDWLAFYERGLRYILKINKNGNHFPEFYAAILLKRMLTDRPIGYVDLRSPAGIGLGALVYNYDGKVFASDEGRMLAEMGDTTFELGDLNEDDYLSLVYSDKLTAIISGSLSQCAPQCSSCVFEPHCGADPVYHHATHDDYTGIKPLSEFCNRQMGIFKLLIDLLENSPEDAAILRRWVQ
ncbi:His-Xaa-Ser system radical SAM maturase HxsB [Methylorubrum sp. B1-46]|uniref:His-Xaa-Ser system radical SAM maturase HxsB n=1 Tax=Methylorubrum sp. B1-46 TaxID=2897334 RepID=UPI0007C97F1F|nr:His-Xaa-Ser system radical SAM maturase HxsB [Methylorubrum sp. B1-46]OAH22457.1 His-Xaa-Ser system radical SAM maturase HxsB [Methylorubrum populi]UGB26237.1 His-Xaa-Ser system radical SAM maturase HxsB [Methylorubrum sp. B1-46]